MEGAAEGVSGQLGPVRADIGKRLIKSPKAYIADSGLACHLLGINTAGTPRSLIRQSPQAGTPRRLSRLAQTLVWQRSLKELRQGCSGPQQMSCGAE